MGYTKRTYHNPYGSVPSSYQSSLLNATDAESLSLPSRFGYRTTGERLPSIPENPSSNTSEGALTTLSTHDRAEQRRNRIFTIGVGITIMTTFFGTAFRPPPQQQGKGQQHQHQQQPNREQVDWTTIEGARTQTSDLLFMGKGYDCKGDEDYSKNTVKTAYELPFAALFKDNRGQKKFEASSVTMVDGNAYAIGDPDRENGSSGYEAIFHHNGTFHVVRKSVEFVEETFKISKFHAIIEELSLTENDDYIVGDRCRSEFEFEGASNGFEGAIGFPGTDGTFYVLGLCEGNHCSDSKKKRFDSGQGRLVLMRKKRTTGVSHHGCIWEIVDILKIPESARFNDYSDIDVTSNGRVVIATQGDSALWIGQMRGVVNGTLDPKTLAFDENVGRVYSFPKSTDCQTMYCNIEGIHFLNDQMLIAVSDRMQSRGRQDYRCLAKDQSIHTFVLP